MHVINTNLHPLQVINFNDDHSAYVIEASAGTGKTWTIERLYIKALLEASHNDIAVGIENILVVTFTNDATNELKERINEQLQQAINALIYLRNNRLPDELSADLFLQYLANRVLHNNVNKDITQLTRALQNFDQASIFTIHGFCQRVLSDYQLECNVASEFELISSNSELIEKLVQTFLRREVYTSNLFEAKLVHVENNLRKMFCRDYNDELVDKIVAKIPKDLFLYQNNNWTLKYLFSDELLAEVKKDDALFMLSNENLSADDIVHLKSLFLTKIINFIYREFLSVIDSLQYETFDNLIQKLANGITQNTFLADILFNKYPIAFIDEFQDTDDLQWQIFSTIYKLNDGGQGHLVVVGDPKQAIYRFRGADVDTYLLASEQIGNKLELTSNYRSHPNIMDFVNQLFSLPNQNSSLATSFLGNNIDYTHVDAYGNSNTVLPSVSEIVGALTELGITQEFHDDEVQIIVPRGISGIERKKVMLQNLTLEILSLLAIDPKLKGKIAILVTTSYEADEVVKFLRNYGLKVAELRLGNIFATDTAMSLYKILLSVFDISLRSNFINALTNHIFNIPFAQLAIDEDGTNKIVEKWLRRFSEYNGIWQRDGIFSLVYHLLDDVINTTEDVRTIISDRELANLYQLAELLGKQSHKTLTQSELLFWFDKKISDAENNLSNSIDGDNEELVRLDNDDEQITITTQHSSKGLEYEILFCPFFKANNNLDKDYNYNRPFFSTYKHGLSKTSSLITDSNIGQKIIENDNKEINRLNYVALTRAKSRLYIFLEQVTITRSTGKYSAMSKPDKIGELFGFVADNPNDDSHPLFNYSMFFSNEPMKALKHPHNHHGVVVFNRDNISLVELNSLATYVQKITLNETKESKNKILNSLQKLQATSIRQSYTAITHNNTNDISYTDYYVADKEIINKPQYVYPILESNELRGAKFGILFHSLCEAYPFTNENLEAFIKPYNLSNRDDLLPQFSTMIDETFNYKLFDDVSLNSIPKKMHELEFNLLINNSVNIAKDLSTILGRYFGEEHQFSQACRSLNKIEHGFLVGFIDLFFEYDGKFWVLDYKTNTLNNYKYTILSDDTEILQSMADHHYYLQYILYLVAIKRYLEQSHDIVDASHLIGGAVYFYVRGAFTVNKQAQDGIFIDDTCWQLIKDVDALLKGVENIE